MNMLFRTISLKAAARHLTVKRGPRQEQTAGIPLQVGARPLSWHVNK